jgi:hypothetical protein
MNPERYGDVILYSFIAQLSEDKIVHACFQQNSATGRRDHVSMALLREFFGDNNFQQYLATEIARFYIP